MPAHTDAFFARFGAALRAANPGATTPDVPALLRRVHERLAREAVRVPLKDAAGASVTVAIGAYDVQLLAASSIAESCGDGTPDQDVPGDGQGRLHRPGADPAVAGSGHHQDARDAGGDGHRVGDLGRAARGRREAGGDVAARGRPQLPDAAPARPARRPGPRRRLPCAREDGGADAARDGHSRRPDLSRGAAGHPARVLAPPPDRRRERGAQRVDDVAGDHARRDRVPEGRERPARPHRRARTEVVSLRDAGRGHARWLADPLRGSLPHYQKCDNGRGILEANRTRWRAGRHPARTARTGRRVRAAKRRTASKGRPAARPRAHGRKVEWSSGRRRRPAPRPAATTTAKRRPTSTPRPGTRPAAPDRDRCPGAGEAADNDVQDVARQRDDQRDDDSRRQAAHPVDGPAAQLGARPVARQTRPVGIRWRSHRAGPPL